MVSRLYILFCTLFKETEDGRQKKVLIGATENEEDLKKIFEDATEDGVYYVVELVKPANRGEDYYVPSFICEIDSNGSITKKVPYDAPEGLMPANS